MTIEDELLDALRLHREKTVGPIAPLAVPPSPAWEEGEADPQWEGEQPSDGPVDASEHS